MTDRRTRPLTIITGANGGMGRACARRFGATSDLVLTDASAELGQFVSELESEGFAVRASITGKLGDADVLDSLAVSADANDGFDKLIHTAGLGPSAAWRNIMDVNYVASVNLLNRLEPFLQPGSVAVLIASVAGHLIQFGKDIEQTLANPLSETLCDELEPLMLAMSGSSEPTVLGQLSYSLSKKKVVDLCMERAAAWGRRGARIVSISPGMIYTNMGRHEADSDPLTREMVTATPLGRWGTAAEIALAAEFLASPAASFITGSDLKLDGGGLASALIASKDAWFNKLSSDGKQE